jgi:hypothetical protein
MINRKCKIALHVIYKWSDETSKESVKENKYSNVYKSASSVGGSTNQNKRITWEKPINILCI